MANLHEHMANLYEHMAHYHKHMAHIAHYHNQVVLMRFHYKLE